MDGMNLGDVARSPCEQCGGGPVRLVRKRIPDTSAGQDISQEFDVLDVWKCEACGHEQGGSFQPDPRLLHEG